MFSVTSFSPLWFDRKKVLQNLQNTLKRLLPFPVVTDLQPLGFSPITDLHPLYKYLSKAGYMDVVKIKTWLCTGIMSLQDWGTFQHRVSCHPKMQVLWILSGFFGISHLDSLFLWDLSLKIQFFYDIWHSLFQRLWRPAFGTCMKYKGQK